MAGLVIKTGNQANETKHHDIHVVIIWLVQAIEIIASHAKIWWVVGLAMPQSTANIKSIRYNRLLSLFYISNQTCDYSIV